MEIRYIIIAFIAAIAIAQVSMHFSPLLPPVIHVLLAFLAVYSIRCALDVN